MLIFLYPLVRNLYSGFMSIFVFAGEDSFSSREAYLRQREQAAKKSDLLVLRDEKLNEESLSNSLGGQTLFGVSPVIAVEGLSRFTGDRAESFISILENAPSSCIIFIWESVKPDVRLKIWVFLKKKAEKFNLFNPLLPIEIRKIALEKLGVKKVKIAEPALALLLQSCGSNLWDLHNEIEKLCLYVGTREIVRDDVISVTPVETEINVFSAVRALSIGDGKNALKYLVQSRNQGEDPRFILSQALREVRAMLAIRNILDKNQRVQPAIIAEQVGVRDFVVDGLTPFARKTTTAKLKRLFDQLVVSFYALNTGKAEVDDVLDNLAMQTLLN